MKMGEIKGRTFDLLTLGQLLLRLSPPDNDRLSRGDTFVKQVGGAELNVAVGASLLGLHSGGSAWNFGRRMEESTITRNYLIKAKSGKEIVTNFGR